MKTGSWLAKLPDDHIKIGISRGVPRGLPAGYRLFKRLAPGPWFNSVSPIEYDRLYRAEILARLDPKVVVANITELAGGRIPVLCCYESKPNWEWCHRAMTARWLADATGRPVPEFGFEHLSQHEHPFMPTVLRPQAPPESRDDPTPSIGRTGTLAGVLYRIEGIPREPKPRHRKQR